MRVYIKVEPHVKILKSHIAHAYAQINVNTHAKNINIFHLFKKKT